MDADDALTELGSVRRLMSEDSAEESEDDSEESDDLDLDPEGDDAMSFVESDETRRRSSATRAPIRKRTLTIRLRF